MGIDQVNNVLINEFTLGARRINTPKFNQNIFKPVHNRFRKYTTTPLYEMPSSLSIVTIGGA